MTDYVKSTNFTSKDSLPSGNALKIVKGTEFDVEFNNIATAVATKADVASPAFSGTPTAPTAASGTNTTQIATTAFVLQHFYPIGSIYINAGVTTNPATLFGFGTWVAFGAGRVMVGLNGSDPAFDALGDEGGSKDAVVVSHSHTGLTSTTGEHTHTIPYGRTAVTDGYGIAEGSPYDQVTDTTLSAGEHQHAFTTNSTGSSGTNANLQPYITVAMWKRTA